MTKVLGIDLDGVLYPWHHSAHEYMRLYRNYTGTYNDLWGTDHLKFTPEDWEFLANIDILYSNMAPTPDCVNFLKEIGDKFTVYYVTSRPEYVRLTTEQYLRRHRFPFTDNLILESDKVNTARRLKCDYFIDDLPKYLDGLSGVTKVIMIEQPYNKSYIGKYLSSKTLMGTLQYLEA